MNERVTILMLINDCFTNCWMSFYRLLQEEHYRTIIIACESIGTEYKKINSSESVYRYLSAQGLPAIDSFNKVTGEHIDLTIYHPDYIFVSNPYDIYRPEEYSSYRLSLIAKVCDIEYGASIVEASDEMIMRNDYYSNCYAHFISSELEIGELPEFYLNKFISIGCSKLDPYLFPPKHRDTSHWDKLFVDSKWDELPFDGCKREQGTLARDKDAFARNEQYFRVVWKPRWTLNNIADVESELLILGRLVKEGSIQLLMIEHPLLWDRIGKNPELDSFYRNVELLKLNPNFRTYSGDDFLDYVLESDMLMGENTSLMAEYSITGNPVLYMKGGEPLNRLGQKIIGSNICDDLDDLGKWIMKLAAEGKKNRNTLFENRYLFKSNKSAAEHLLYFISSDIEKISSRDYLVNKCLQNADFIEKLHTTLYAGYLNRDLYSGIDLTQKESEILDAIAVWNEELTRYKSANNEQTPCFSNKISAKLERLITGLTTIKR